MNIKPFGAPRPQVIAVAGSGFSGTLVAVNLARFAAGSPVRILLFERGERFARGVAYGTSSPHHLLNVPAGMMSALVEEPAHFLTWLQARDPDAHAGTFAPRLVYGEYLEALLEEARGCAGVSIELIQEEVVDLDVEGPGSGVVVTGRTGGRWRADRGVLALGNPSPQDALECPGRLKESRRYISNSWQDRPLEGLRRDDALVLIGTGLSAVDLIVEARAGGFRGPLTVISRHGLLPQRHRPVPPRPIAPIDSQAPVTPRSVLQHLRREATRCEQEGGDWRSAIDALRPSIQGLWRAFSLEEKRRFVRHLGSRWDVHRHRVAPEIDQVLDNARREGQLRVIAGRIRAFDEQGDGVNITLVRRGFSDVETLFAHRVINCTGPSRNIRIGQSPLLDSLIDRGFARTDPLSLGLEVTESGALITSDGNPSDHIFALGPILKGQLWETTAVRELRVQALDLARHLVVLSEHSTSAAQPGPHLRAATDQENRVRLPRLDRLGKSA